MSKINKEFPKEQGWVTTTLHLEKGEDGRQYSNDDLRSFILFLCGGNPEQFEIGKVLKYKTRLKIIYRKDSQYLVTSNKGFKVGNGQVINLRTSKTVANYYPKNGMTWLRNMQGDTTCLGPGKDPQQQVLNYYTQLEHEIKMAGNHAFKNYIL